MTVFLTERPLAGKWLHGEAVSAGIVMAADLSQRLGWIDPSIFERTKRLLQRAELPIVPPKVQLCARLKSQPSNPEHI